MVIVKVPVSPVSCPENWLGQPVKTRAQVSASHIPAKPAKVLSMGTPFFVRKIHRKNVQAALF
jgi:hypothetical protein